MIARRGKSKRNQVLRDTKNRKVVYNIPILKNISKSVTKAFDEITNEGDYSREILELFVYIIRASIRSSSWKFYGRRHRTDRNLTTRNIIYYWDNSWIIVLVKSKNARYAYRIGPEMFSSSTRLESSAPQLLLDNVRYWTISNLSHRSESISCRIPSFDAGKGNYNEYSPRYASSFSFETRTFLEKRGSRDAYFSLFFNSIFEIYSK